MTETFVEIIAMIAALLVFAPSEPDLAAARTVAGDFHEGELARAVDRPPLVGAANRPTLCYGVN
jgi:DNA repair protein RadD